VIDLRVTTEGAAGVAAGLEVLAAGMAEAAADSARAGGVTAAEALQREIRARLSKRSTGRMANSVETQEKQKGDTTEVTSGATVPYAGVQDTGNPNHGAGAARAMAIPAPGASPGSPRGRGLELVPARGGPILAIRDAKRRLSTEFYLRRSISIPGTHYREAAGQTVESSLPATTEREVKQLLEEAARASGA
jgi:hypothetical protein